MIKVGDKVIVHRKTNPIDLAKKLWEDVDDIDNDCVVNMWDTLIYDLVGNVIAYDSLDGIFVDFSEHGMWCLKEDMLEVVE